MKPNKDTPLDTQILVCNYGSSDWTIRRFAGISPIGKFMAFKGGISSAMASGAAEWDMAQIADTRYEQLLPQDKVQELIDAVTALRSDVAECRAFMEYKNDRQS